MKKKIFTISALVLLCVAMIGVGFAGWVITSTPEPAREEGSITAEAVTDESYTLTLDDITTKFVLAKADTENCENPSPWLKFDGDDSVYEVVVTGIVKQGTLPLATGSANAAELTVTGNAATTGSGKVSAEVSCSADGYQDLVDNHIISGVSVKKIQIKDGGVLEVTLSLTWGTYFDDYGNPYKYFNDKYTSSLATNDLGTYGSPSNAGEEANKVLSAVYKLNSASYKVKVSVGSAS